MLQIFCRYYFELLYARQIKNKKRRVFIVPSLINSLVLFLSLYKFEFLTYVIFFLLIEQLLIFLTRQDYPKHISSSFLSRNFCFSLTFEGYFVMYRITGQCCYFSLNILNISLRYLLVYMLSENLDITIIFALLQIKYILFLWLLYLDFFLYLWICILNIIWSSIVYLFVFDIYPTWISLS